MVITNFEYPTEKERVKFLKSIDVQFFQNIISEETISSEKNNLYYYPRMQIYFESLGERIRSTEQWEHLQDYFHRFSLQLQELTHEIVNIYICHLAIEDKQNWLAHYPAACQAWNRNYEQISKLITINQERAGEGNRVEATLIQNFCLTQLARWQQFIKEEFFIDISSSPFAAAITNWKKDLHYVLVIAKNLESNSKIASFEDAFAKRKIPYIGTHWDKKRYTQFCYLLDEVESNGKIKPIDIVSIWYFLRDLPARQNFFQISQTEYKKLVEGSLGIKINNWKLPPTYETNHYKRLKSALISFEESEETTMYMTVNKLH